MDAPVVQAGQQQDGSKVRSASISNDGLVGRPGSKVLRDAADFVVCAIEVVEGNEKSLSASSDGILQTGGIVGSGSDTEGIVAVGSARSVSLGSLKGDFILDSRVDTLRYHLHDGKTTLNRSLSRLTKVARVFLSSAGNKGLNGDETREGESLVRGLVINAGDVECGLSDDSLNEQLGILDVGNQRNSKVDSHSSRLVTLGDVTCGSSEPVLGRQVDVQVDQVIGKMLAQRVLLLLRIEIVLRTKLLEVLDRDTVLLNEVGSTGCSKQVIAHSMELVNGGKHLKFLLEGTNGQEDVLLGRDDTCGDKSLQVGIVSVLTETSDFTSRSHLNTENRVRTRQSAERELGDFNTHVVAGHLDVRVGSDRQTEHDLGSNLDGIDTGDLGDKGEGSSGTEVTFNNLDLIVLGNELNIVRTGNIERLTNLLRGNLNLSDSLSVEVLGGKHEGSVTRVYTSVLDVLGDVVHHHLTISGDSVHLNFLGLLDVLGDNDGMVSRNVGCLGKVVVEVILGEDNIHRRTRQNVRGTDKHGVADLVTESFGLRERSQLPPQGLVDTNLVKHSREFVSVFGSVDHFGGSAIDLDVLSVKRERNVVRGLTTHGQNDTARVLSVIDVKNGLERDVLKVQLVCLIVIGRHSFRIIVDHDCLHTILPQCSDGPHSTPIEFNGRTDSVNTRTEDHNTVVLEVNIMLGGVVSSVKVVGERGELGGNSVNLLDKGSDTSLNTETTNSELVGAEHFGDLSVGETKLLSVENEGGRNIGSVVLTAKSVSFEDKLENDSTYEITCSVLINLCNLVKNQGSIELISFNFSTE